LTIPYHIDDESVNRTYVRISSSKRQSGTFYGIVSVGGRRRRKVRRSELMNGLTDVFEEMATDDPTRAYRLLQLNLMVLERRVSLRRLARAIGCSHSWLYKIFAGKIRVSDEWLDKIDDAIDGLTQSEEAA